MTIRSVRSSVTFTQPFALDGIDGVHPAGTYDIDTDEELIENLSFLAWRRVATFIHLPRNAGLQMHKVDPAEVEEILALEQGGKRRVDR